MNGRPLRFLGLVLGGWVGLRVVMLWPAPPPAPSTAASAPVALDDRRVLRLPELAPLGGARLGPWLPAPEPPPHRAWPAPLARAALAPFRLDHPPRDPARVAIALLALTRFDPPAPDTAPSFPAAPTAPPGPAPRARWSGSGWLIARGGPGIGAGPLAGQLGGSQAGARLAFALEDRIALAARVAAPLAARGSEAALGVEYRALPGVRLVAEQRFAIDGAGGGPALGLVTGFGPKQVQGFRLEAYGQAGVIGRGRGVYYVDGAARIEAPIARARGFTLGIGAGAWGAAQTGAERLDLGPTLGATLPLGPRRARLTLDWRARVAGGAAPGSGPALSLGADF